MGEVGSFHEWGVVDFLVERAVGVGGDVWVEGDADVWVLDGGVVEDFEGDD